MRNINDIFIPDNDHIHHLIYNKTKSNVKTLIIINLINFIFFIINYNIFKIYDMLTLIFFIIEFFIFFILRRFLIR